MKDSQPKPWKKITSKTVLDHPRMTLVEDTVELPSGEHVSYLKHGTSRSAAMIICIRDHKVLLQKEYSYPPDKVLYQFPGGAIEKDEKPIEAARRELIEEAGLDDNNLEQIGWYYMDNRRSDHKMYAFLSTRCFTVEKQGGDLEEDIISEWVNIDKVPEMIRAGLLVNASLLAAWSFFCARTTK